MGAIIQLNMIYLQSATWANDVVLNILMPVLGTGWQIILNYVTVYQPLLCALYEKEKLM
jgi:hypothetical protein